MLQPHPLIRLLSALLPLILMIVVTAALSAASVRPISRRFTGMTMAALGLGLLGCVLVLGFEAQG